MFMWFWPTCQVQTSGETGLIGESRKEILNWLMTREERVGKNEREKERERECIPHSDT